MEVAKRMHLPVIFTYHTPMMTCGQSGMLYQGKRACLGRVNYKRCLICAQTKYNIPLPIAWIWANLPRGIASALGKTIVGSGLRSRFATWLQLPWLTRARMDKWELGFKMIDRFVAVCQWVLELLLINNVPKEKITLCRQGIGQMPLIKKRQSDDILHLGYLGRIHPVKGIDVLLRALKLIPSNLKVELSIYGSYGEDKFAKKYHDKLYKQYCNDSRIKWQGLLSEGEKFQALSQLDVLVIPSAWLETGPLVLLESWAAGTPVIGSNLGGIAELVNDGTNGLLFKRGDARDLSRLIMQVYNDPDLLEKLKTGIPGVRTMREVVDDMEILYQKVIK
jgi:glycosyltransferase involved in cell wall biosynthesis